MTRTRKTPMRTCIGCGLTGDKRSFVRIIRTKDGHIDVDVTGKANGRGAYLCGRTECFDAAVARRRFDPALRVRVHDDDLNRLRRDLEALMATHATSQQGR